MLANNFGLLARFGRKNAVGLNGGGLLVSAQGLGVLLVQVIGLTQEKMDLRRQGRHTHGFFQFGDSLRGKKSDRILRAFR